MNLKETIDEKECTSLGLMCGLEIHQQLEGRKLFGRMPTIIRDDKPDYVFKRYLRASAGESGIVDKAAAAESLKKKYYLYEGYTDTIDAVECDEEPPAPVSKAAIRAALQISKIFSMHPVDQLRFMRKTVVNGSNTSGFQRTGLVAQNGQLGSEIGNVRVESLCLEEDSCKEVEKTTEYTRYNLSRLGIPLLEIATAPDIKTPSQAKDVAEYIGMVLRSLPNTKRGLGTIRQDVNVSIKKGVRVEIKGAQDLKMLPTLVEFEALRQHNMVEIFEELKKRKATVGESVDISSVFKNTTSSIIKNAMGVVLAVKLTGFVGITGLVTQPGRRFGSELADHAKVMGVKGLFHGDELPNYGVTQEEKDAVYKALDADPTKDGFILIAGSQDVATRAIEAVIKRASNFALTQEVRVARPDGTSAYMRPMPGAARMYPETDVKPIHLDLSSVEVPVLLNEQIDQLSKKFGIAADIAKRLIRDDIDLVSLTKKYSDVKPSFIIDLFYALPGLIKKQHKIDVDMKLYADELLDKLNSKKITKDVLEELTVKLSQGKQVNYDDYKLLSLNDIKDDIRKIVESLKDAPRGAVMGKVMAAYKGKVDGKELSSYVNSLF